MNARFGLRAVITLSEAYVGKVRRADPTFKAELSPFHDAPCVTPPVCPLGFALFPFSDALCNPSACFSGHTVRDFLPP